MGKFIDLTGMRFNRLLVIRRVANKGREIAYLCKCDCGKETIVTGHHLRNKHTQSCGCYGREVALKSVSKCGGDFGTRLQRIWKNMKDRCDREYCKSYRYYGGRGIKVCEEWYNYMDFKKWALSNGYADNLTIDRIDNNGNYEPSNCRWVDMKAQCNNNSHNHFVTIDGETHTIQQWCDIKKIKRGTFNGRIYRGWSIEDAILRPVR